jgi:acyltransferase
MSPARPSTARALLRPAASDPLPGSRTDPYNLASLALAPTSTPSAPPRSPGLDAARALAVTAMVFGHSAEALLSWEIRMLPAVQVYWTFRGLTAPLFLFVSGWAVVASVQRSTLHGHRLLWDRAPRVLLLLGLGYTLRYPAWNFPGFLAGDPAVWRHFLAFDALHCIGSSLLIGAALMALFRGRAARLLALCGAGALAVASAAPLAGYLSAHSLPMAVRAVLHSEPASPFSLLPWSGYFFLGAGVGLALPVLGRQGIRAIALLAVGGLVTWLSFTPGITLRPPQDASLFLFRAGQVLVIAGLMMLLPLTLAKAISPVGKSALVVYVFHLPIVYGWALWPGLDARLGRVLALWEVAAVAFYLLAGGLLAAKLIRAGRAFLEARWRVAQGRSAGGEPAPG